MSVLPPPHALAVRPPCCVQVTAYRAGHVLGAAMFMVEIAGMRLLYTGDYSRLPDRHLSAADLPQLKPHIGHAPVYQLYNTWRKLPGCPFEKLLSRLSCTLVVPPSHIHILHAGQEAIPLSPLSSGLAQGQ